MCDQGISLRCRRAVEIGFLHSLVGCRANLAKSEWHTQFLRALSLALFKDTSSPLRRAQKREHVFQGSRPKCGDGTNVALAPFMLSQVALALATGFGLALLSSLHCTVMCGPLLAATHARGHRHAALAFNIGRTGSYAALGALAGGLGHALTLSPWARWAEAVFSWGLGLWLLQLGVRQIRAWRLEARGAPADQDSDTRGLVTLGRPRGSQAKPRPRSLWGRILPRLIEDPLLLGAAVALLPCGALWGALAASAALSSVPLSALAMAAFASLTGVAMAASHVATRALAKRTSGRWVLTSALLLGALVMFVRPLPSLTSDADQLPSCHGPASPGATP